MTHPARRFGLFVAVLALALGACRSGIENDPILRLSAEESLVKGKELFAREKYSAARPYFTHAFEVEPNSTAGREALLLVADSLFRQGGDSNLIQAEAKYRDYQNRFPTSDRGAYVQLQIAKSLADRIERADRDQSATVKAVEAYQDLLRLYPTSDEAETAHEDIVIVRDRLAEHEFLVGSFYLRYGLPAAAISRFEGLLEKYPDYGQTDKSLFYLAQAYGRVDRADDEQATYSKLRSEFPESPWTGKIPERAR